MLTGSKYRITGTELLQTIENWEHLINFKVNLIGCGGTALTLLEIKDSTKDIDFIVPIDKEYVRLMKFLRSLTNLLDSPLDPGGNIPIKKWRHIYLGALNLQDLIITKMFRGMQVDVDDCVAAFARFEIDPEELLKRYAEATKYEINPEKMMQNFIVFAEALVEKGVVKHHFIEKVAAYK